MLVKFHGKIGNMVRSTLINSTIKLVEQIEDSSNDAIHLKLNGAVVGWFSWYCTCFMEIALSWGKTSHKR
jgi:hypothetical protein